MAMNIYIIVRHFITYEGYHPSKTLDNEDALKWYSIQESFFAKLFSPILCNFIRFYATRIRTKTKLLTSSFPLGHWDLHCKKIGTLRNLKERFGR